MFPVIIFIKYKDFNCTAGLFDNSIHTFLIFRLNCRNLGLDFIYEDSNFKLKEYTNRNYFIACNST